jgi:hypothetical protein
MLRPWKISLSEGHPTQTTRTSQNPNDPLDSKNEKGQFWGYDGSNLLCAPPRLYNQVATSIALNERPITKVDEMAYYLALINVVMADAGIVAWNAKYVYRYARPITYFRQVQPNDVILGTRNSEGTPLGGPDTNSQARGHNFTPPFPAYPSGHATFGGRFSKACGVISRQQGLANRSSHSFRTNTMASTGVRRAARPRVVRKFRSLTEAEAENARSRIWVGVHWQFDADQGVALGR